MDNKVTKESKRKVKPKEVFNLSTFKISEMNRRAREIDPTRELANRAAINIWEKLKNQYDETF